MSSDVIIAHEGHLGLITLDRPRSLNALTTGMIDAIAGALARWEHDPSVRQVAVRGAGERGLCGGGDIVAIHSAMMDRRLSDVASFWAAEYRLNAAIARYPKPYVALMDGFVLGGGVGISAHGSHRVATERSVIGMPETRIGFFPDVGATWLLSRAPGELGTLMALTSMTIGGADAIEVGLADYEILSTDLDELVQSLATMDADAAIARLAAPPKKSGLHAAREWVDVVMTGDDVQAILESLRAAGDNSTGALARMDQNSPLAMAVTLRALRNARLLPSLDDALAAEYRLALRMLRAPDFAEGIRARLIDRDDSPQWTTPPTDVQIDGYFTL